MYVCFYFFLFYPIYSQYASQTHVFDVHTCFALTVVPSYDLLGEEDPDDFVNVDIPEDLSASDTAIMPPTGGKERPNIRTVYKHTQLL